jgi:hypothetical protein
MDFQSIGRLLLVIGIGIAILGAVFLFLGRLPIFSNLGRLPGDIRIETGSMTCFVPIVSMILVSVILTIIVNVIIRLINRP